MPLFPALFVLLGTVPALPPSLSQGKSQEAQLHAASEPSTFPIAPQLHGQLLVRQCRSCSPAEAAACPLSPPLASNTGAAILTISGVQVKVCGGIRISRDRTALRKLWRSPSTSSLPSSGGKAEGDESWGMMLPPTCFTAPCEER